MKHAARVRVQVPHRLHVRVADRRVHLLREPAELHRVERIDPSSAPVGSIVHPRVPILEAQNRAPGAGDDREPIEQPLGERQTIVLRDLGHDRVGAEPGIGRAREQEPHVLLRRHLMRGRGGHHGRRIVRAQAIAGRMTNRAVDADALEPDRHLRKADRHLVPVLAEDAERGISPRRRKILGENAREGEPHPVRNAVGFFGADRPEEEMILVGGEEGRRLGTEEMVVGEHAADDRQHEQRARDDAEAGRFEGGGPVGHEGHVRSGCWLLVTSPRNYPLRNSPLRNSPP